MGDIFKEQLVKRKPTIKDTIKKVGILLLAVIVGLLALAQQVIQVSFLLVLGLLGFGVYYMLSFFYIEYEYAFTNGELDIDIIYNRARRKRLFSGAVKDFELMAHVEDQAHAHVFKQIPLFKDCSSGMVSENTYAFITNYKGKKVRFIFEPNEMMLQAIGTALTPRKLIRKR